MRIRTLTFFLASAVAGLVASAHTQAPAKVSFHRQIKPILQKRCQGCHQPASQGGKLILTTFEAFRAGGAAGPSFKPGDPDGSVVMRFITGDPPAMPKNAAPLGKADVELFRRWIKEGARNDTPAVRDPISAANPPKYSVAPVISALAFSPDGQTIAMSGYREALLHRADGSGLTARLVGPAPRIESITYSPDGKYIAVVGGAPAKSGEVQFWESATNKLVNRVELSYDVLYGGSFSPDSKQLAVGGADNSVRILSVPDGTVQVKFDNHSDWVFATGWTTPDMKLIAAEIQKYAEGNRNRPLMPEDAIHLLTTGRDRAIKLIVAKNGSFVDDINTHTSPYRTLAVRPKSIQVLAAGDDGIPRLYQIYRTKPRTMNQEDQSLVRTYEQHPGQINAVAFSADGTRFATGSETGEIRVYSSDEGKRLLKLTGGSGPVYTLAFGGDGKRLAVGGFDGTIRLYDAESGASVASFVGVPLTQASSLR